MPALLAFLLSLPLIVLVAISIGVLAVLRAVFGRRGGRWVLPLLLFIALLLAVQGVHLAGHLLGPLVLIGAGVLLLRGGRGRLRPVQLGPTPAAHLSGSSSLGAPIGAWRERQPVTPRTAKPAAEPLRAPQARPDSLEARLRRLPSPAREEALALYTEAGRAVNALDEHTPPQEAYTIRATLQDYLPESVDALLAIPEARRTLPLAGGQTPLQLLREQLRLMRAGLERAQAAQNQASAERLLAHKRFLEERFGKKDDFQL